MKILCVFGKHNYGNPARGLSYEYANFVPAMRALGHEVSFFDCWNKSLYRDFADLNRSLVETVVREDPDVIFFVLMTYEVWTDTLKLIRKLSPAALVHWSTDDSWKYEQFSRFIAAFFDLHVTTYPAAIGKAERDGLCNFFLSQWAADSSRMRPPRPARECSRRVSFIGSAYGDRGRWIKALADRGIDVECYGYGWPNGPVASGEIADIIRDSLISLNFSGSGVVLRNMRPCRDRQIKARVFEVPGAGGLLLTERAEGIDRFYSVGKEILVFDRVDDLAGTIKRILADREMRDMIAERGYRRTVAEHTYEHRFQEIFSLAARIVGRRRSGMSSSRNQVEGELVALARRHAVSPWLAGFGRALSLPFQLFFGPRRGRRAARRLLYEVSWRLAGGWCYSASGWPGRIFYQDS